MSLKDDVCPVFAASYLRLTLVHRYGLKNGHMLYNEWADKNNPYCPNQDSPETRYQLLDYDSVEAAVQAELDKLESTYD